jgi:hypothetical protein
MVPSTKKVGILTAVVAVIVSFLPVWHGPAAIAGIWIGALWGFINYILTVNLFSIALGKADAKRVANILVAKFPVLYGIGYLILISHKVPTSALLAGLLAPLVAGGVSWLRMTRS